MVREIPPQLVIVFLVWSGLALGGYLLVLWLAKGRGEEARAAVRRHGLYVGVFYAAFAIYLGNCKRHMQVDTQIAPFAAMSLVAYGGFDLSPFERNIEPLKGPVCTVGADGRTYSRYPPGSTLACVPFVLSFAGSRFGNVELDFAAKRGAALSAALALVFALAAFRRLTPGAPAWVAAVAFGFGTPLFSTAAADTWTHGPAMLGLAVALYGIARTFGAEGDPRAAAIVGAGLGWAGISRPTMAIPIAMVTLYFLVRDRRRFLYLAAGAAPFALFWIVFAWRVYGSPFRTGYSRVVDGTDRGGAMGAYHFVPGATDHLWQTWFNPSRGVLVYSPFFALGALGLAPLARALVRRGEGDEPRAALAIYALSGIVLACFVGLLGEWPAGWSYGYRSDSEAAILLMPPFALAAASLWRRLPGKIVLAVALAVSISIHALEWAFPNDVWNANAELQSESQILVHLRYARHRLGLEN